MWRLCLLLFPQGHFNFRWCESNRHWHHNVKSKDYTTLCKVDSSLMEGADKSYSNKGLMNKQDWINYDLDWLLNKTNWSDFAAVNSGMLAKSFKNKNWSHRGSRFLMAVSFCDSKCHNERVDICAAQWNDKLLHRHYTSSVRTPVVGIWDGSADSGSCKQGRGKSVRQVRPITLCSSVENNLHNLNRWWAEGECLCTQAAASKGQWGEVQRSDYHRCGWDRALTERAGGRRRAWWR